MGRSNQAGVSVVSAPNGQKSRECKMYRAGDEHDFGHGKGEIPHGRHAEQLSRVLRNSVGTNRRGDPLRQAGSYNRHTKDPYRIR